MMKGAILDCAHPAARRFMESLVTAEDRLYADRFNRAARAAQSLAGRALLRALLAEFYAADPHGMAFASEPGGPPQLASKCAQTFPNRLWMSVAHSRDCVAAAVSDRGPVGIDVECCAVARRYDALAAIAFGEQERAAVARGGASAFYRIWTLREAFAKAARRGFAAVVEKTDRFACVEDVASLDIEQQRWAFAVKPCAGGYIVALALQIDGNWDALSAELRQGLIMFPGPSSAGKSRITAA